MTRALRSPGDGRRITAASARAGNLQKRFGDLSGGLRGIYNNGSGEAIVNATTESLSFIHDSLAEILDLATVGPTSPLALFSAKHELTVTVFPTAVMTAGGWFAVQLLINGAEAFPKQKVFQVGTAEPPMHTITLPWWCDAGHAIQIGVENRDGAATRTFIHSAYIQLA